jgi:hypothetical protein
VQRGQGQVVRNLFAIKDVRNGSDARLGLGSECGGAMLVHNEAECVVKPAEAEEKPIFNWDTMREVGHETLRYEKGALPGKFYEVELANGQEVTVWRSDDCQQYFCHGLTFGGKEAPGGAISPYGKEVPTILRGFYDPVPESQARPGDIVVFHGADANDVVHSAIITGPVLAQGNNYLGYSTRLQSKNGSEPEANVTLEAIILEYGESYNTYRRR